ncbi:MAG: hypothetical protein K5866_02005 [Treponema sp.]|nr:hypothetical protein [Treponema sp.]
MQELRSTEILDKEILEDAQKKVQKILKNSEAECRSILSSVDDKVSKTVKEKEAALISKLESIRTNLNASLPLEKERFQVSFVENLIISKIQEYLKSLSQEKRIQLVLEKIKNKKADAYLSSLLKEKTFTAYVYGFDIKKVEKALEEILGKNLKASLPTDFGKLILEDEILDINEGIILESQDKEVRFRMTLIEVVEELLNNNRAELAETLFTA